MLYSSHTHLDYLFDAMFFLLLIYLYGCMILCKYMYNIMFLNFIKYYILLFFFTVSHMPLRGAKNGEEGSNFIGIVVLVLTSNLKF